MLVLCFYLAIPDNVFDYKPLSNRIFAPSVPFYISNSPWQFVPAKFVIVLPYTKAFLIENPQTNRTIQSWKEYASFHGHDIYLTDATPIIKLHGQAFISSVEKRHGNIYVTGKPLVALVTFRKLLLENAHRENTWMLFLDMDTAVTNPFYRLEDLVGYATTLTMRNPKRAFHAFPNSTKPLSGQRELATGDSGDNYPSCHMIGQLAPSTVNSGFLLFPFTNTAHLILQDWAQQTLEHSLRNEDWQGDQGIMQTIILKHLMQVVLREYHAAHPSSQKKYEESNAQENDSMSQRRFLVGAKHPTHYHHKSPSEHNLRQERSNEKRKQQYRLRQQKLQMQEELDKKAKKNVFMPDMKDANLADTSVGTSTLWNQLFGASNKSKEFQKGLYQPKHSQNITIGKSSKPSVWPNGICIEKAGNVERGRCFGRTMRDTSVLWDNTRALPFCLISGVSPIGIFNVHDWPIESERIVVSASGSQYTVTMRSPLTDAEVLENENLRTVYQHCGQLSPSFYHGKDGEIISKIVLLSESTESQQKLWQSQYEQLLVDSRRTDQQRVSPRTTILTSTECDHFWKHFLLRHIESWNPAIPLKHNSPPKRKPRVTPHVV